MTNPVVEQSMTVRPETVIVIIGVCFVIFIVASIGVWVWTKLR